MKPDDLQFLHGQLTSHCVARVDKHFVGYYTLQYATRGGVELFYGQERHEILVPTFWPASPGPRIRFHALPPFGWWEHRYIAFRGPLADAWLIQGLYPSGPQAAPRGREHSVGFDQLMDLAARADHWSRLRAINLLEGLLLELAEVRDVEPGGAHDPWLTQLQLELSSPSWKGDYDSLARRLNMGLSTLRRRFRAASGIAIHDYVIQCRMAAARKCLADTDEPIKQIAKRLGYSDLYFFTRQFRERIGVPPAEYRRSRQ